MVYHLVVFGEQERKGDIAYTAWQPHSQEKEYEAASQFPCRKLPRQCHKHVERGCPGAEQDVAGVWEFCLRPAKCYQHSKNCRGYYEIPALDKADVGLLEDAFLSMAVSMTFDMNTQKKLANVRNERVAQGCDADRAEDSHQ